MEPKEANDRIDYAVAAWDFPASAATELKAIIQRKADAKIAAAKEQEEREFEAMNAEYETPVEPAFKDYARDPEQIKVDEECGECHGGGRVNEKHEYDPEIGGEYLVSFEYCECKAGRKEREEDENYEARAAMAQEMEYQRQVQGGGWYEV